MAIIWTAESMVKHIKVFNLDKTVRRRLLYFHIDGLEFNIGDGVLGFIHPKVGWIEVHDFKTGFDVDAVPNVQWVVDTYAPKENNK